MTQLEHFIMAGAVAAALPVSGCASKSIEPCDATARHSELANAERRSAEEHAAASFVLELQE